MTSAVREQLARLYKLRPVAFSGRLGFGRLAGLASARRAFPTRALTPARRMMSLIIGSLMVGTGIALLTNANLGLSPYDVLVSGLMPRIGLSFGQTVWAVSGVMFLVAAIFGRRPSRWGVAYVLSIGFSVDTAAGIMNQPESLPGQLGFVAVALVVISAGISLVVHSGSTGGSFELLMLVGEDRGMDRRRVRTVMELTILVLGIMLGGSFGPATIIVALSIGPLLGVMGQALNDHSVGRAARLGTGSPETRHPSAPARAAAATRS